MIRTNINKFDNKLMAIYTTTRIKFVLEVSMLALKNADILNSIVPISRFNKGEANKIFSEVKSKGIRIVVKNNIPECVLISPEEYQKMVTEYESAILLAEAEKRAQEQVEPISQNEVLEKFNLSDKDLDNIEVEIE